MDKKIIVLIKAFKGIEKEMNHLDVIMALENEIFRLGAILEKKYARGIDCMKEIHEIVEMDDILSAHNRNCIARFTL